MNSGYITQLEPPVLPVSPEKSEPLVVIKNEPPESESMEIGMDDILNESDIKDIDIVSHTLCEDLIKSETISENILKMVFMKTENVKIENIIQSENLIKTEDTCDDNGQEMAEVQGNLETDEQQVFNFYNDLNNISVRSPKPKHPKRTDFAAEIKVFEAPVIPVKSHEYITLAKNEHVCNHCQVTCKKLYDLKVHIRAKHREVTTIYQCLYCSFKSKWKTSVRLHIIRKHKSTRDNLKYHYCDKCDYNTYNTGHLKSHKLSHLKPEEIQYFYCHYCSYKSKYKGNLNYHVLKHFENVENKQNLKRYHYCDKCDFKTHHTGHLKKHEITHLKPVKVIGQRKYFRYHYCNKCNYKTYIRQHLNNHKIIHLKPEEIEYFNCYHCSYKSTRKCHLQTHIFRHFLKEEIKFHCYICDFMTLKRDMIIKHLKKHFKHPTKCDEATCKYELEDHTKIRYHYCDKCNYKTDVSVNLKKHKIIHLKPEEIQYFYCYHCSHKSKRKNDLKYHIFRHFENGDVPFHCYICDFMTTKRELIIGHIKKHSKVQIKSEINEGSYMYHYCDKCDYKTDVSVNLKKHKIIHLKPEEIQYFYCYHCSHKSKRKHDLKCHILRHFKNGDVPFHCYICDFMTTKRELIIGHIKKHSKVQIKSEINEGSYMYHYCDKCDYKTDVSVNLKKHKIIHLKPEEIQYFYCYHCSHKSIRKHDLKCHILRHFKNGDVPFHCYICGFMALKRELIIGHIKKKHSKVQIKLEINEGS